MGLWYLHSNRYSFSSPLTLPLSLLSLFVCAVYLVHLDKAGKMSTAALGQQLQLQLLQLSCNKSWQQLWWLLLLLWLCSCRSALVVLIYVPFMKYLQIYKLLLPLLFCRTEIFPTCFYRCRNKNKIRNKKKNTATVENVQNTIYYGIFVVALYS